MSEKSLEEKFEESFREIYNECIRQYQTLVPLDIKKGLLVSFETGYSLAQKELEEQIKEAREVIEFYARSNNWAAKVVEDSADEFKTYATIDDRDTYAEFPANDSGWISIAGGKLARAYLEKWK